MAPNVREDKRDVSEMLPAHIPPRVIAEREDLELISEEMMDDEPLVNTTGGPIVEHAANLGFQVVLMQNPWLMRDPLWMTALLEFYAFLTVIPRNVPFTRRRVFNLMNMVLRNHFLVVMLLGLLISVCDCKVQNSEVSVYRSKREGFGPPEVFVEENQAVWKTIETVQKVILEEEEHVLEAIAAVRDVLEHPLQAMRKSWVGTCFLFLMAALVIYVVGYFIVRIAPYVISVVKFLPKIFTYPCSKMYNLGCCITCFTWGPIARYRLRRQIAKEDAELGFIEPGSFLGVTRATSTLKYDEHGPYLLAPNGMRVYFSKTENLLETTLIGNDTRLKVVASNKESYIAKSVPRVVDKFPDFQGCFMVDNAVIGQFSRVKWHGRECILTAFHVLQNNRGSVINICKDNNMIAFHDVRKRVIAWSSVDEFDFILLEVPLELFSKLQIKQGKIATRLPMSSPVSIYQFDDPVDGNKVVTNAIVKPHGKPWHIEYGATTFIGASGAPVLDLHRNIVGVHLQADYGRNCNVGIIPPIFRQKESLMNNDVIDRYEIEEEDFKELDAIREETKDKMRMYVVDEDDDFSTHRDKDWATLIDEFEQRTGINDKLNKKIRAFRAKSNWTSPSDKQSDDEEIDYNSPFKESPWTCTKCGLLHLKGGYNCCKCSGPLKKASKAESVVTEKEVIIEKSELINKLPLPIEILDDINQKFLKMVDAQNKTANAIGLIEKSLKDVVYRNDLKDLPEIIKVTKDLKEAINRSNHFVKVDEVKGKITGKKLVTTPSGVKPKQVVLPETANTQVIVVEKDDSGKKKKRARKNKKTTADVRAEEAKVVKESYVPPPPTTASQPIMVELPSISNEPVELISPSQDSLHLN